MCLKKIISFNLEPNVVYICPNVYCMSFAKETKNAQLENTLNLD